MGRCVGFCLPCTRSRSFVNRACKPTQNAKRRQVWGNVGEGCAGPPGRSHDGRYLSLVPHSWLLMVRTSARAGRTKRYLVCGRLVLDRRSSSSDVSGESRRRRFRCDVSLAVNRVGFPQRPKWGKSPGSERLNPQNPSYQHWNRYRSECVAVACLNALVPSALLSHHPVVDPFAVKRWAVLCYFSDGHHGVLLKSQSWMAVSKSAI
ncbi:hypothetical protein VTK26DRAFT_1714 [Humicola hyalothermophila]